MFLRNIIKLPELHHIHSVLAHNKCVVPTICHLIHATANNRTEPVTLMRKDAEKIFTAAVASVSPQNLVKNNLRLDGDVLHVAKREYNVKNGVHIVAFGKAVLGMVKAAEEVLGERIINGIASVPTGLTNTLETLKKWELLPSSSSKVVVHEGALNNIPDQNAFDAARNIKRLLDPLCEEDFVLTLISGGGSALLPYPVPPLSLDDVATVTKLLSHKGATIQELNSVRKHLEILKGGGLVKAAAPARMATLILSDVIGDDLDFIASGPTVPNLLPPRHCLELIQQFDLEDNMPPSVLKLLKKSDINHNVDVFPHDHVENVIVGSNSIALEAAKKNAEQLGYIPIIMTSTMSGNVTDAVKVFGKLLEFISSLMYDKKFPVGSDVSRVNVQRELELVEMCVSKKMINELRSAIRVSRHSNRPLCVLSGGETTVNVTGKGLGGRNQQMAMLLALELNTLLESQHIHCSPVFLSAGTDGQDGPTDAAGAMVDGHSISTAYNQGLQTQRYLDDNDSYSFFKLLDSGKQHVMTGLTGTNVMDLQMLLLKPNYIHKL